MIGNIPCMLWTPGETGGHPHQNFGSGDKSDGPLQKKRMLPFALISYEAQTEVLGRNLLSVSGNEAGFPARGTYSEVCLHLGSLISVSFGPFHVYDQLSWVSCHETVE